MRAVKAKIWPSLKGFGAILAYPVSGVHGGFSDLPLGPIGLALILGAVGSIRNVLEVWIGGKWARGWFALAPDIAFTMFWYPIFLCFFCATLLHYFSNRLGMRLKMRTVLSLLFCAQVAHLIIPFLDALADRYNLPFRYFVGSDIYIKMIFSPIALTPLILIFTYPTSLGIDFVWALMTVIFLKFFIKGLGFPVKRTLVALSATFYITYMSIYPTYFFFINENKTGSNYMFGIFFMLLSIPSFMYCEYVLD